jgi:hypothetical protein
LFSKSIFLPFFAKSPIPYRRLKIPGGIMMKKQLYLLLTCLATATQTFAGGCFENTSFDCGLDCVATFDLGGGVRQDKLQWKSDLPGLQTREKWNNVQSGIIEGSARFLTCETYLARFDFDYGWIYNDGHQHVKRFDTEGAEKVLLSNVSSRTKGNVYDLSGALGYQFNWCCYQYALTPMAGYSYNYQRLKNNNYRDQLNPENAELQNLDNRYTYRWQGPWIGVGARFQPTCEWQLYAEYAYHWSRVKASVNEVFLLGESGATLKARRAQGNEVTVGTSYVFCNSWSLGLKFNYKHFFGKKGKISTSDTCVNLKGLKWTQYNGTVDLGYSF